MNGFNIKPVANHVIDLVVNLELKGSWLLSAMLIPFRLFCFVYGLYLRVMRKNPVVLKIKVEIEEDKDANKI